MSGESEFRGFLEAFVFVLLLLESMLLLSNRSCLFRHFAEP